MVLRISTQTPPRTNRRSYLGLLPEGFRPSSRWHTTPDSGKGAGGGAAGRCVTSVVRWRRRSHGGRRRRRLWRLRWEAAVSGSHAPGPAPATGTERRAAPAPGCGLWASSADHPGKVSPGSRDAEPGGGCVLAGRASVTVAKGPR